MTILVTILAIALFFFMIHTKILCKAGFHDIEKTSFEGSHFYGKCRRCGRRGKVQSDRFL